jgi:protein involved in polysaccharide export with SLBB domain
MPVIVEAEGGIVLPGSAGRAAVGGLTLEEARSAVGTALATIVRKRDFDLSLVRPRRFKVYVTGAVRDPGMQEASAATRVSEVLDRASILPEGSRRAIQIQRVSGDTLTADLAAFSGLGAVDANPFLDGGDVIRVGFRGPEVGVFGGVAAPGIYELTGGETLRSLVELAGGVVAGARPELATLSHTEAERRTEERLDLSGLAPDALDHPSLNRPLAAGDVLVIPIDPEAAAIHHVLIEGEVMFPGRYPIRSGVDTAAEVLAQAGGFSSEANVAAARIVRARPEAATWARAAGSTAEVPGPAIPSEVGRSAEPEQLPEALPVPLFDDLPSATQELELSNRSPMGDEVRVSWVNVPLADSVRLRAGDRLYVPRLTGRVRVDGRVRAAGLVPYEPGRELEDYVELAGGYDKRADKRRVYLQRAGRPGLESAKGAGPIQDGDAIWVPETEPRGAFTSVKDVVVFLAQVATIAIVIDQLVEN